MIRMRILFKVYSYEIREERKRVENMKKIKGIAFDTRIYYVSGK